MALYNMTWIYQYIQQHMDVNWQKQHSMIGLVIDLTFKWQSSQFRSKGNVDLAHDAN